MAYPDDFESARLTAERLRAEHAAEIHRMHVDAQQMAFIGGVRTDDQTSEYMARSLAHWDTHGFGVWVLRDRTTRDVVGRVLLRVMPHEGVDEIELGYSFDPLVWGRGYATEIGAVCLEHARAHFGFSTFVALTAPHHEKSQHVLRKLGFRLDGVIDRDGATLALFRARAHSDRESGIDG